MSAGYKEISLLPKTLDQKIFTQPDQLKIPSRFSLAILNLIKDDRITQLQTLRLAHDVGKKTERSSVRGQVSQGLKVIERKVLELLIQPEKRQVEWQRNQGDQTHIIDLYLPDYAKHLSLEVVFNTLLERLAVHPDLKGSNTQIYSTDQVKQVLIEKIQGIQTKPKNIYGQKPIVLAIAPHLDLCIYINHREKEGKYPSEFVCKVHFQQKDIDGSLGKALLEKQRQARITAVSKFLTETNFTDWLNVNNKDFGRDSLPIPEQIYGSLSKLENEAEVKAIIAELSKLPKQFHASMNAPFAEGVYLVRNLQDQCDIIFKKESIEGIESKEIWMVYLQQDIDTLRKGRTERSQLSKNILQENWLRTGVVWKWGADCVLTLPEEVISASHDVKISEAEMKIASQEFFENKQPAPLKDWIKQQGGKNVWQKEAEFVDSSGRLWVATLEHHAGTGLPVGYTVKASIPKAATT